MDVYGLKNMNKQEIQLIPVMPFFFTSSEM